MCQWLLAMHATLAPAPGLIGWKCWAGNPCTCAVAVELCGWQGCCKQLDEVWSLSCNDRRSDSPNPACRKQSQADEPEPVPGTSRRPYLCPVCKYKRKAARLKEPVPLIRNSDTVAQLYLKRWAELRKNGVRISSDNFAELVAPISVQHTASVQQMQQ